MLVPNSGPGPRGEWLPDLRGDGAPGGAGEPGYRVFLLIWLNLTYGSTSKKTQICLLPWCLVVVYLLPAVGIYHGSESKTEAIYG